MKILGRTLLILVVFSIMAGLMVTAVNASGANAPDFNGAPQFRPGGGENNGFRPEGGDGNRPHGEGGRGGFGLMFGMVRSVGVMAVLVMLIVWPKSVAKKKKKEAGIKSERDGS